MKNYNEFNHINEFKFFSNNKDVLKNISVKELGEEGKLIEYIDSNNNVKFGILKALYQDAILYKKKKGI